MRVRKGPPPSKLPGLFVPLTVPKPLPVRVPTDTPHRFIYPPTLCWPALRLQALARRPSFRMALVWLGTDTNLRTLAPPAYPACQRPQWKAVRVPRPRALTRQTWAARDAPAHHGRSSSVPPGQRRNAPGLSEPGVAGSIRRVSGRDRDRLAAQRPALPAAYPARPLPRDPSPSKDPPQLGGSDDGGELYLNKSS